ncbi:hypothetical protein G6O67_005627 [Ophiocordyceps sinensis]|nr:hypothetical protein G6O67_005627 [Ophiocordyceps sinensis]
MAAKPLIAGISDSTLSLIVPVVVHWLTAAVYELFQRFNLFQQYRIHTSNEEGARNTISRLECLRGVLVVQALQTGLGLVLGAFRGHNVFNSSSWGLDVKALVFITPFLAEHELELLAKLFHGLMPALRFYTALWLADTWVFFIHRAEHRNQWLYKSFHARHHELYVPYSWGGIYDHPVESLFLSVGAFAVAVAGTGMSLRESIFFSGFSSAKACTDHGGYRFPWNPVDLVTTVDAAYHDKHHQRWGFKKNFALHFRFWDRLLGTELADADAARLYARDREAAERVEKRDRVKSL